MSVGSSALGTLLVQRLDAVLGTTMAQHANLMTGARPDAISQAAQLARISAAQDATTTDLRHSVERVAQHADPRNAVRDARVRTVLDTAARQEPGARTPSAPTHLGGTARLILALLAQFPDRAPAAAGRQPLWQQGGQLPVQPSSGRPVDGQPNQAGRTGQAAGQRTAQASLPRAGGGAQPSGPGVLAAGSVAAMPGQVPNPAVLARALSQALTASGMFYESHLADLAFGKRTPHQLAAEPQARLAEPSRPDGRSPQTGASQPPTPATVPVASTAGSGSSAAQVGAETASTQQPTGPSAGVASGLAGAALGPEAAMLVRQQLEVLAHQMFSWQGEAWRDAPMDWEVQRHGGDETEDVAPSWATRIRILLPRLGEIEARLSLAGESVVMHLSAPESADILQAHAQDLRKRYEDSGLALSGLSVDAAAETFTAAGDGPHGASAS